MQNNVYFNLFAAFDDKIVFQIVIELKIRQMLSIKL